MSLFTSPDLSFKNFRAGVTEVFANYTLAAGDYFLAVLDTTVPRTITLPLASTFDLGRTFIIKDETGGANVNNITVLCTSPDNIEGVPQRSINSSRGGMMILVRPGGYAII